MNIREMANLNEQETDKDERISEQRDINETCAQINTDIYGAADKEIGKTKPEIKKSWITENVIRLIDKRRLYKNSSDEKGKSEYRKLRNLVNREAKKA